MKSFGGHLAEAYGGLVAHPCAEEAGQALLPLAALREHSVPHHRPLGVHADGGARLRVQGLGQQSSVGPATRLLFTNPGRGEEVPCAVGCLPIAGGSVLGAGACRPS